MAREIIHAGLVNHRFVDRATVGFAEYAAHVEPYTLAEGERITGVPADMIRDDRARVRARRPRDDLLDARHHRAPRRRRQRALADQPRAAVRPRRPLGLGPQPAARPEQRAGRRRHGRHPEQAAGLPGHRARRRGARPLRGGLGLRDRAALRLEPDADVRGHEARRAALALRDRREPGAVRGRHQAHARAARGPRFPGRAGHPADEDGRDGRRRAAVERVVVRVRGHGDELRAPRAARAQGARPARRGARRRLDHQRDRRAHGLRLGPAERRGGLGRSCARSRRCTAA